MSLLGKTSTLVNQIETAVEERSQLQDLKLEPLSNDNYDLINLLAKTSKNFRYLQEDIDTKLPQFRQLQALVVRYNGFIDDISHDPSINVDEYRFELSVDDPKEVKSVRFKDNVEDNEEDLRNQLMGTRQFKPYTDEEVESSSVDSLSNHQMFAQHQQQLLSQDEDLDVLHESVKVQKSMGLSINREIDEHMIILNDLESGVDVADRRLRSTQQKLGEFRQKVQENGSLVTIISLTVILILLLVVLN